MPAKKQKVAKRDVEVTGKSGAILASVGQRVRQERLAKGLRLTDLSQETAISVPTLSKFENGRISLNFRHLVEIARALNVPVNRFMGGQASHPAGRRSITPDGQGYRQTTGRIDFEILCDDLAHRHNIFWKARIKSRSLEEYGEFSSHPGEEFILVLAGEILLHTASYKPLKLRQGDAIHFDSMSPHAYIAVSQETPVLLISNTVEQDFAEHYEGMGAAVNDEE